uniref:Uncharacterized protein n=1 Tax=Arundo donax TaxID=35708 RepID=A0A0A9AU49_ARUDO
MLLLCIFITYNGLRESHDFLLHTFCSICVILKMSSCSVIFFLVSHALSSKYPLFFYQGISGQSVLVRLMYEVPH